MRLPRRSYLILITSLLVSNWMLLAASCASAPASLSPVGVEAFNKARAIHAIDALRDVAIEGNRTVPPLISTDTTRKFVVYHRSTLLVVNAQGAKAITATSLDELVKDLPANEGRLVAPYVALIKTIINEVK